MNNFKLKVMLLLAVLLCGGVSAFADTTGIEYTLSDDLTAEVSDAEADITTANIPEKITYKGKDYTVTTIEAHAFEGCYRLTSVVIPNSVTSIRSSAFKDCRRLRNVTIGSGVGSIDKSAFSGSSPDKVIWLGNTPPKGYENVNGKYNYVSNDSFTGLSNTKVYPSLSSMFEKDGIKYVPVNSSERTCNAIDYVYALTSVCIPEKVTHEGKDYTVTGIEGYTLYGCGSLTSVVIPNSVTSIGEKAFWQCGSLHSITIGSGVQSIAETAFALTSEYSYGRTYYTYIRPEKVIWLGNTPPEGYKNVNGIYNYVSNDSFTSLSNTKVYPFLSSMFEKDGIKYVPVNPSERTCDAIDCMYDSTAASINIGKTVNYKGIELAVNDIRPYTCYGNKYVKSVKVDYGGEIPGEAFYACDSIASADIAATKIGASAFENSATKNPAKFVINADTIENSAFKGSRAVTEAKITAKAIGVSAFENSATKEAAKFEINAGAIGYSAFKGSSVITEAKITAKTIGISAFENCATKNPAKFEISADTIGNSAFKGSSAVTEANITAKVIGVSAFENSATKEPAKFEIMADEIANNAFTGCSKMENAVLGESLKSIGNSVFKDCASLKGITIPDSVTGIGGSCFSFCI